MNAKEFMISNGYAWPKDPPKIVQPKGPSLYRKAISFLRAITSGVVSSKVYKERLNICSGCEFIKREDGKSYCGGGCGCGSWKVAELQIKLKFPKAPCPKGFWEEAESNFWNSVLGSVAELIKGKSK